MATGRARGMMASRHFIAEALGGISLVGVLTFAAQWGSLNTIVRDHVDTEKHALIVVAGNTETGEKIAVIETKVEQVQTDIAKGEADREQVKRDVSEVKGDVKLLLELQRRILERQPAPSSGSPP